MPAPPVQPCLCREFPKRPLPLLQKHAAKAVAPLCPSNFSCSLLVFLAVNWLFVRSFRSGALAILWSLFAVYFEFILCLPGIASPPCEFPACCGSEVRHPVVQCRYAPLGVPGPATPLQSALTLAEMRVQPATKPATICYRPATIVLTVGPAPSPGAPRSDGPANSARLG